MKTLNWIGGVICFSGVLVAPLVEAQTYVLTDLGAAGDLESYATGLNSNGVVVGYSVHASGMTNRAWRWTAGLGRVYLGGLGGPEARAQAINQAGSIAGYATDPGGVAHGFVFTDGAGLVDIGTLPDGGAVFPQAINNSGAIAGYAASANGNAAFFWPGSGALLPLGTLPGADSPAAATAFALNDSGRIVGEGTWIFGGTRAFVGDTNGGALAPLETLGGETGEAFGINNAGQIVGDVESKDGSQHPFLYDGGTLYDLGTLGGPDATAFFINDLGDIAGSADVASGEAHAFLWSIPGGLEDLNPLIDPGLGWVLNEAQAVNENGLIVGQGTFGGVARAFLLVPRSGPDTRPPSIVASLNINFVATTSFSPLYLVVTAWDDVRVEAGTLSAGSVRVTGPGGYSVLASLTGRVPSTNAIRNVATYQIAPRGGVWDGADNGAYTVSLEPNSVRDLAGNFAPAVALATFTINIDTMPRLNPGALPAQGAVNVPVSFAFGASSSYPATNWFSWAVDWDGDGAADEIASAPAPRTFTHTYTTPGARFVRFILTDQNGLAATNETVVNILGEVPPGLGWQLSGPGVPDARSQMAGVVQNGRIHLLGGYPTDVTGTDPLGATEYLDAGATGWLPGASFDQPLVAGGAGVDNRGRIVLFGGGDTGEGDGPLPYSGGFVYTVAGGRGSGIAAMSIARKNFACAADPQQRLYAIGGYTAISGGATDSVDRYDGVANRWTPLAPLPAPRANATACYDGRGRILVIGGDDSLNRPTATTFAYDIGTDSWSELDAQPAPLDRQAAALAPNGLVYVIGGGSGQTSAFVFDPVANAWGFAPSLRTSRSASVLVVGPDNLLWAISGDAAGTIEKLDVNQASPALILKGGGSFNIGSGTPFTQTALAAGTPRPRWSLLHAPAGMMMDATSGDLTWTPAAAQAGNYVVVMRAQNSAGLSDAVLRLTVTSQPPRPADSIAPSLPASLVATNITDTAATLIWAPSTDDTGVAGYRLYTYRRVCTGGRVRYCRTVSVLNANNLTATTYQKTGLLPGHSYTFGVAAFDSAGNQSGHQKVTFLTHSPPRIVPGYISAQSSTYAIVNEPWEQQFNIYGNPLPTLSLVSSPPGMSLSGNLVTWHPVSDPPGTNQFTLRAVNDVTSVELTVSVKVYPAGTDLLPPGYVTGVKIDYSDPDSVAASWNPASDNYGIAGYEVTAVTYSRQRNPRTFCGRGCRRYYSFASSVTGFSSGPGTNFLLNGLYPGTPYTLYVRAIDTSSNRGPVSVGSYYPYTPLGAGFTTPPLLETGIAVQPDGTLLFDWTAPEPPVMRLGDYFAYTVLCSPILSNQLSFWSPLPGVTWPVTNTSVNVPASGAPSTFYRVKADYIVAP